MALNEEKIPLPPLRPREMFLPLAFWSEILVNFDKRIELICKGSGYGIVSIDIKIHEGQVREVGVEEKTRIRSAIDHARKPKDPQES